ncbi:MAG: ZapG family protein [Myxococcota bacterium]
MSLDPSLFPVVLVVVSAVALGIGVVAGRQTGNAHARIRELEAEVESSAKKREFTQASLEAAKREIARVRSELEDYRGGVVEHFTGTSMLLRDLTHQYRAVYEHLTAGATTLCPEGSIDLLEGMGSARLPEAGGVPEAGTSAESPNEPEGTRSSQAGA